MQPHSARRQASAAVLAASSLAALMHWFPPGSYHFYPPCPFRACFGILCPGCGATRALAALLSGRWDDAVHLNPLFVALAPFLAAFLLWQFYSAMRWDRWCAFVIPPVAVKCFFVVAVLFAVVRNLSPG